MSTAKVSYATSTAMTITLASLAFSSTAGRESTAVDNTSNLYDDYQIGGLITTGTTPTNNSPIELWLYGSYDGTTYAGAASGSDAALTPTGSKLLFRRVTTLWVSNTSNVGWKFGPYSVYQLFGGTVPKKWGLWVLNNTGVNLNSTGGNHAIYQTGITWTSS